MLSQRLHISLWIKNIVKNVHTVDSFSLEPHRERLTFQLQKDSNYRKLSFLNTCWSNCRIETKEMSSLISFHSTFVFNFSFSRLKKKLLFVRFLFNFELFIWEIFYSTCLKKTFKRCLKLQNFYIMTSLRDSW